MTSGLIWYLTWTGLLALMLFFPMTNLIWTLSVRRLQRKTGEKLSEVEAAGQKNRARFLAIFLSSIFAALFNYNVFGIPGVK